MSILLTNTWSIQPITKETVPRYLALYVESLLSGIHVQDKTSKLRFMLQRKEDMFALQAAIPMLFHSDVWEAVIVDRLDNENSISQALSGMGAVLWVDNGRDRLLARDGRALLNAAAERRIRRFVFRSQVHSKSARRSAAEAVELYVPSLLLGCFPS